MTYYRRLPPFDYLAPKSISEVSSLSEQYKGDVRFLAGGTLVLHQMKERIGVRPRVIGLKGVAGLDAIAFGRSTGLTIGSMARLQSVADSEEVKEKCPLLATVCGMLGTPQIRNMGTLGGNAAMRFSTSETLPALIALRAQAKLMAEGGERTVLVEDLYKEMKSGNLLMDVRIPTLPSGTGVGYEKFAVRERFDYATVAAAVVVHMDGKTCRDITIGLGGVTLPSMRANAAEVILKGRAAAGDVIKRAAETAAEGGHTTADVMFSADYKKKVLRVVVEKAIKKAIGDQSAQS
jgi:carbon-monoxide dehydrogenase medium subunit